MTYSDLHYSAFFSGHDETKKEETFHLVFTCFKKKIRQSMTCEGGYFYSQSVN